MYPNPKIKKPQISLRPSVYWSGRTGSPSIRLRPAFSLQAGHNRFRSHPARSPLLPRALRWLRTLYALIDYSYWINCTFTGAGERVRTVDNQLGRLTLYQLSYSRLFGNGHYTR